MIKQKTLFISMLLLLSVNSYAAQQPPTAVPYPTKAAIKCPSSDFHKFLAAFKDNVKLQKAFTLLPQTVSPQVEFPVIPNAKDRIADRITLSIKELTNTHAKVILDKAETDYRLAFTFVKNASTKNACWRLIRIEDLSG